VIRTAIAAVLGAVVVMLTACSSGPRAAPQAVNPAALPRLDAFRDSRVVVTLPPQAEPPPSGATLDDGTRLEAEVFRIFVNRSEGANGEAWLPAAGAWGSIRAKDAAKGVSPWVVVVQTPRESDAKTMTVAGRDYALNWLPDVSLLPVPNEEAPEPLLNPWPAVADDRARADPGLLRRVSSEAQSPLTRWRYKLLFNGLAPRPAGAEPVGFKDPVIEAIARQNEDRWRVALAWLWSADPELAWRLKQRVAAVVDFGAGVHAPAWPLDHAALDLLLASLLNASITPERRVELARAWLMDQPSGVAWVIDDSGVLDEARRTPVATIGFANLGDVATRVWVESQAREDSDFLPLLSLSSLKLLVPVPGCETAGVLAAELRAHIGRSATGLSVLCDRVPVQPPGLTIGPLVRDYSMQAWLRGPEGLAELRTEEDWATAALLHRPAPDPAAPPSRLESRRWELVVECRLPSAIDPDTLKREAVMLYFGSPGKPTAILRIDMTGGVRNVLPADLNLPPELAPSPGQTEVTRAVDRWSFRFNPPPGAVEHDGTLRLGIVRTDARGVRSAWPRPMLPWQAEPGRAALHTRAWGGSGE